MQLDLCPSGYVQVSTCAGLQVPKTTKCCCIMEEYGLKTGCCVVPGNFQDEAYAILTAELTFDGLCSIGPLFPA